MAAPHKREFNDVSSTQTTVKEALGELEPALKVVSTCAGDILPVFGVIFVRSTSTWPEI